MFIWTTRSRLTALPEAHESKEGTIITVNGRQWQNIEGEEFRLHISDEELTAIDGGLPSWVQEVSERLSVRGMKLRIRIRQTGEYEHKSVRAILLRDPDPEAWVSINHAEGEGAYVLSLTCTSFGDARKLVEEIIKGETLPTDSYEREQTHSD